MQLRTQVDREVDGRGCGLLPVPNTKEARNDISSQGCGFLPPTRLVREF